MSKLIKEVNKDELLAEANRCLKCKMPRCKKGCPISTDIPTIMNLFLEGKEREAGRVLFENNPLSAICSIVCPHENNCYGNGCADESYGGASGRKHTGNCAFNKYQKGKTVSTVGWILLGVGVCREMNIFSERCRIRRNFLVIFFRQIFLFQQIEGGKNLPPFIKVFEGVRKKSCTEKKECHRGICLHRRPRVSAPPQAAFFKTNDER